jgi:hypothetical protein
VEFICYDIPALPCRYPVLSKVPYWIADASLFDKVGAANDEDRVVKKEKPPLSR